MVTTSSQPPKFLNELVMAMQRDRQSPFLAILTGKSGSGKTLFCQTLIDHLDAQGVKMAGIITPSLFKEGQKTAIMARDLTTNDERILATSHDGTEGYIATDHWLFDEVVLHWADEIFNQIDDSRVIIIDELGKLEFSKGRGLMSAMTLVDRRAYKCAVVVIRPSLLSQALERWPETAVIVDLENGSLKNRLGFA